ncbi:Epidermal growth factor receptor substrate 15-like 1, partial [Trichinella sp. T9]
LLDKQGFFIALKLIALVQQGQQPVQENLAVDVDPPMFFGSGFTPVPFADNETEWCIQPDDRKKYEDIFYSLMPVNGKLSGEQVKPVLFNSGLSKNLLRKIWDLSDIDKDGHLDKHEMTLALHLVYRALENDPVPDVLPLSMIPPAKREQYKPSSTAAISRSHFSSTSLDGPPRSRASSVTSLERYSSLEHTAPKHPFVSRSLSGVCDPSEKCCSPYSLDMVILCNSFFCSVDACASDVAVLTYGMASGCWRVAVGISQFGHKRRWSYFWC